MPPYRLVLVAAAVVATTSTCPNSCSHRGVCSAATGLCTCYPGFDGSDCSLKACPHGLGGWKMRRRQVRVMLVAPASTAAFARARTIAQDAVSATWPPASAPAAARGVAPTAPLGCAPARHMLGQGRCVGATGTCECDSGGPVQRVRSARAPPTATVVRASTAPARASRRDTAWRASWWGARMAARSTASACTRASASAWKGGLRSTAPSPPAPSAARAAALAPPT